MLTIGTRVRTRCGSSEHPYWEYGFITAINDDGTYKVEWDGVGYDHLYDFEVEVVRV